MKTTPFLLLTVIAFALVACSAPGLGAPTITPCPTLAASAAAACPLPTRTPPALPAGALFQVLLADGKSVPFTQADLAKLTSIEVSVDGKSVPGYRLQDVLAAAGAAAYSQVTFNGETTITLTKDQLDAQTALAPGSSVRLAAPSLPAEQQVNGIVTIRVK